MNLTLQLYEYEQSVAGLQLINVCLECTMVAIGICLSIASYPDKCTAFVAVIQFFFAFGQVKST